MTHPALRLVLAGSLLWAQTAAVPIGGGSAGQFRDLIVAVKSKGTDEDFTREFALARDRQTFMKLDEVCAKFGPRRASISAVHAWAAAHGATLVSSTRCSDFMVVRLPEQSLPAAFAGVCPCKPRGGCSRPGAVPTSLKEHCDFIDGIGPWLGDQQASQATRDYNPASRRRRAAAAARGSRDNEPEKGPVGKGPWYPACLKEEATPPCLKTAYNCSMKEAAPSTNSQGVALFGGQFFSPDDLVTFEHQYKLPLQVAAACACVRACVRACARE
jgi:hypothetical protein